MSHSSIKHDGDATFLYHVLAMKYDAAKEYVKNLLQMSKKDFQFQAGLYGVWPHGLRDMAEAIQNLDEEDFAIERDIWSNDRMLVVDVKMLNMAIHFVLATNQNKLTWHFPGCGDRGTVCEVSFHDAEFIVNDIKDNDVFVTFSNVKIQAANIMGMAKFNMSKSVTASCGLIATPYSFVQNIVSEVCEKIRRRPFEYVVGANPKQRDEMDIIRMFNIMWPDANFIQSWNDVLHSMSQKNSSKILSQDDMKQINVFVTHPNFKVYEDPKGKLVTMYYGLNYVPILALEKAKDSYRIVHKEGDIKKRWMLFEEMSS